MRAILTYHSIDSSGSPVSLAEETFQAHAGFLASGRVKVLALADLPGAPDHDDAVALTFDDGFKNFATRAMPLLMQHGLPATVFVVSDAVGGTNTWGGREVDGIPTLPLMEWSDLESASASGFEIGAHTRSHPDLTTLSVAQLEDETAGCVDRIFSVLGHRPSRFAYPYGAVNEKVAGVARAAFTHCVTTELRAVDRGDDVALLPRLDAWYFRRAGDLEAWGSAAFRRRLWIRAQGRRVRQMMMAGGRSR